MNRGSWVKGLLQAGLGGLTCSEGGELKSGFSALVVADADRFFHPAYEDLSIADSPGPGGGADGRDCFLFHLVQDNHFNFYLRQKIYGIFSAAVELGVALLAAMSACLQNRHAFNAHFEQRVFDCVELRRLDNRFNLEHA